MFCILLIVQAGRRSYVAYLTDRCVVKGLKQWDRSGTVIAHS